MIGLVGIDLGVTPSVRACRGDAAPLCAAGCNCAPRLLSRLMSDTRHTCRCINLMPRSVQSVWLLVGTARSGVASIPGTRRVG